MKGRIFIFLATYSLPSSSLLKFSILIENLSLENHGFRRTHALCFTRFNEQDLGQTHVISWNHQEFEVRYECLSEEIKIGDYYLRLLLEEEEEKTLIHNA